MVAPDLVGFGRSDKPDDRADYTYARHVEWMRAALFDQLGLSDLTLVGQDWGGLIGLRLVAEHPDRFRRVVAANTGLPTGDMDMGEAFLAWQRFSQEAPELPVGRIVAAGCTSSPSEEVVAAYDAPFPDEIYKEGARQFPLLVPTRPDDPASEANRRAWEILKTFDKPFLCAFSDADPITKGADALFLAEVPGTRGQEHPTISGAGHFLQEDSGPALADAVIDFVRANPAPLIPRPGRSGRVGPVEGEQDGPVGAPGHRADRGGGQLEPPGQLVPGPEGPGHGRLDGRDVAHHHHVARRPGPRPRAGRRAPGRPGGPATPTSARVSPPGGRKSGSERQRRQTSAGTAATGSPSSSP